MITVASKIVAGIAVAVAAAGCATESAAFRNMSAEEHERAGSQSSDPLAGDHLAAARDLRRAEQTVCSNVPEVDRDRGPFSRRDRIESVQVIREKLLPKPLSPAQAVGVAVYLRAEPGLTEQWVGRVVECHRAHRAVVGAVSAEACPLDIHDARVSVSSTETGFRVSITSHDPDVARSLIDGCQTLASL